MTKTNKLLAFAILAAACIAQPAFAQDKAKPAAPAPKAADTKVAPGTTKNVIDNDKVLVIEITYKPGQGTEMRERGPRVVHALTDGTMERTAPDGKKETVQWKKGETKYFGKETFANTNIGKSDVHLLVTNLK